MALSQLGTVLLISYVGLARASVLAGDTAKARKAFKDFFELWKDADQKSPYSHSSKERLRGTTLISRQRNTFGINDEMYQAISMSPLTVSIASDCGRITGIHVSHCQE